MEVKQKYLYCEVRIISSIVILILFFIFLPKYKQKEVKIVIEPKGIVNLASLADGVQIIEAKVNGQKIDLIDFFEDSDWFFENGRYTWNAVRQCKPKIEAVIKCYILEIAFLKNEWCGSANIYINDILEEKVDFYSEEETIYLYQINGFEVMSNWKRVVYTVFLLILVNIVLGIKHYLYSLKKGNKGKKRILKYYSWGGREKKRIEWIDISKGIGILMVILGHDLVRNPIFLRMIWSVHMPLFFIIAGYTFKKEKLFEQIKKSSKRLVLPYISAVIILMFFDIIFYWIKNGVFPDIFKIILDYIGRGIYGSGGYTLYFFHDVIQFNPIGAIWFLCAMFLSRIFLELILEIEEKYRFGMACCISYIGLMMTKILTNEKGIWLPWSLQSAMTATIFMYIGFLIHQEGVMEQKNSKIGKVSCWSIWSFVFCCGSGLYMVTNTYPLGLLDFIGAICGSACIVYVSQIIDRYTQILKRGLIFLGQNTIVILIFHLVELNFIDWKKLPYYLIESGIGNIGQMMLIFLYKLFWCILFIFLKNRIINLKKEVIKYF